MNTSNNQVYIYWERQGSDKLCGVHALNSLLQGPFYNEFQLAEIARELDAKERELMAEQGYNESSENVADDGNYSIQVLSEALARTANLTVASIDSESLKTRDLSEENGFICNSSAHWLTIRKVNGKWYNLNSTNKDGPELVSDFYLSAFLNSVRENGYIIFVVQGDFPHYDRSFFGETLPHQKFYTEAECLEIHQRNMKKKNYKLNIAGTDERDLEEAIERSLQDFQGGNQGGNEDDELERAIKASLQDQEKSDFNPMQKKEAENKVNPFQGQGITLSSNNSSNEVDAFFNNFQQLNPGEDPELAFAIKLSMEEKYSMKPDQNENTISLNIRFPDSKVHNWIFNKFATIEEIYTFVYVKLDDPSIKKFRICTNFPRKPITNLHQTIEDSGLEDNDVIVVEKL